MNPSPSGTSGFEQRLERSKLTPSIFAATAASIMSASQTPTANASPASTPGTSTPVAEPPAITHKAGLSTAVRVNQEVARRGLYSRFFRGAVVKHEDQEDETTPDVVAEVVTETVEAGPSSLSSTTSKPVKKDAKGKSKEKDGESKEEKRARRAQKAKRKAEKAQEKADKAAREALKETKKAEKEERRAAKAANKESGSEGKKRKRNEETATPLQGTTLEGAENKKKRKSKD